MARNRADDIATLEAGLAKIKSEESQQLVMAAQRAERDAVRYGHGVIHGAPGLRVDYIAEVGRDSRGKYMILRRSEIDKQCSGAGCNSETIIAGPDGGGRFSLTDAAYSRLIDVYGLVGFIRSGVKCAVFSARLISIDEPWRGIDFDRLTPPFVSVQVRQPTGPMLTMTASEVMRENRLLAHKRLYPHDCVQTRATALKDNARVLGYDQIVPAFLKHAVLLKQRESNFDITKAVMKGGMVYQDGDIAGILTVEDGMQAFNHGVDLTKTQVASDMIAQYIKAYRFRPMKPDYIQRTGPSDPAADRAEYDRMVKARKAASVSRGNDPRLSKYLKTLE